MQKADIPNLSCTNSLAKPNQIIVAAFLITRKPVVLSKVSTDVSDVMHECINNFDICLYREKVKARNTSDICDLSKNILKPDECYSFPKTDGRSFRYKWLNMYSWLCYSPCKDGAFCLACVLFGYCFPARAGKISKLFSEPSTGGIPVP